MKSKQDYQPERELRFAVEQSLIRAAEFGIIAQQAPALIAGVSGGEDSHALLHVLHGLRERLGLRLAVCHVDHRLRESSALDAAFVRDLAGRYNLPFYLKEAPERPRQENVEAWARKVRYEFFASVAKDIGAHATLTAHHRNDQAETVLFRLLTGRLLTSARGIQEIDRKSSLIRPLLNVQKPVIQDYIQLYDLPFVTDESNFDGARTRNRIRRDLLPSLAGQYNPNIVEDLALTALRFGDDDDFLWERARETALRPGAAFTPDWLRELPAAIRWRVLAVKAEECFGEEAGKIGFHAYAAVVNLIDRQRLDGPRVIELGFGFSVRIHPVNAVEFEKLP